MNWFKNLFRSVGSFFRAAAKTVVGIAASEIGPLALNIVKSLHNSKDMSGSDKRDMAIGMIKEKYPSVGSAAINFAIEAAWAIRCPAGEWRSH